MDIFPTLRSVDILLTNKLQLFLPHNPFFTTVFSFFSFIGSSLYIWVVLAVTLLVIEEIKHPGIQKQDKQFAVSFFLSVAGIAGIVNLILKPLFHRIRPVITYPHLSQSSTCGYDFSFPSGHAATAFAAAVVLSHFDTKRKWLYYFLATVISYSRIYLSCHYVVDVSFGGLIGALFSCVVLKGVMSYRNNHTHVHKR